MCTLTQVQLNTLARTAKRENDPTKEQFNVIFVTNGPTCDVSCITISLPQHNKLSTSTRPSFMICVCMQNYKYAALCYLSIFNNVLLYNFCFFKYEVAFIVLNVLFLSTYLNVLFFLMYCVRICVVIYVCILFMLYVCLSIARILCMFNQVLICYDCQFLKS